MAPTKVKCFSRLVVRKACLTHEALQKRELHLASTCPLCTEANETNNHPFLHCKVTSHFWSFFVTLAAPEMLDQKGRKQKPKGMVENYPTCIWWTIWMERNERIFKGKSISIQKIKGKCISTLFFWCKEQCIADEI
ncbi:unnamed protein product [Withania somnifera]